MGASREAHAGGQAFDVTASGRSVQVESKASGERTTVDTQYLGHGRLFLVEDDVRRLAWVAEDADRRWVYCDGEVVLVEFPGTAAPARRRAEVASGHQTLSAPMPATVVKIVAPVGSHVARGATVLLLEAMKMELPLRAPHDALVSAVHCREGELVQPGVTLADLEAVAADSEP